MSDNLGSSAAAILEVAYLRPKFGTSSADNGSRRGTMCIAGVLAAAREGRGRDCANGPRVRVTLDPNQFVGPPKQAYQGCGEESRAVGATALLLRM